ncbi:hypothetical protein BT96DRAFT_1014770 [Gymnopus androsaceus JB14]|uniref:SAP domain-containing protein n=1 Tax=Gymnopus androsaceus JB14 TaxID=1447944 RepID=A0A6A4I3V5_9AGAR|nr:hypothetical protein BT96DRAFT_1014770 [Gymnopus androsaceus JB14]
MSSSSQTTEILFNSPALHSLKRDQLVKLCKIHSIKASGKNVELIQRLKKVAEDLPKDAPLSIAARNDEAKENSYNTTMNLPRPSEQWEAMESIAECDGEDSGSRNGTLKSLGSNREFGTGGSKSSTVSSSIKALASSLGLKRSTSAKSAAAGTSFDTTLVSFSEPPVPVLARGKGHATTIDDELSKHATPYTSLPITSPSQMPQTDHFSDFPHFSVKPPTPATLSKFDFTNREDSAPLPGHVLRPGAPAPDNARLSLGDARFSLGFGLATPRKSTAGPTTTIRLVSSSSMTGVADSPGPATSTFDTFNNESTSTPQLKPWNTAFDLVLGSPSGHGQGENVKIYPDLPMDDLPATKSEVLVPGSLSIPAPNPTASSPSVAKPEPFIFGSPLPQHRVSNAQFQSAATSVLDEMNRRLLADGVETVGTSLISTLRPGAGGDLTPNSKKVYTDREIKPLRKSFGVNAAKKDVREKFDKAHQNHFEGMESIATYLDRKNKIAGLSSPTKTNPGSSSSALDDEPVQVGRKRKSSALGEARPGPVKRPSTRVISNTRRTVPGGFGDDDDEEEAAPVGKKARVEFSGNEDAGEKDEDDEEVAAERSEKEREAIRRKLELNRARRRSSAANGRASMGRGRASVGRKSILHKPPPKPAAKSRFGFLSTAAKSIVKGVWGGGKKASAPAPATVPKPAPVTSSSTTSTAPTSTAGASSAKGKMAPPSSSVQRKVSTTGTSSKPSTAPASSSIRTSHSRNASNSGTMNSLGSVAATINSARSRSPLPSFTAHTRSSSIRTSTTGTMSTRNSSVASRTGGSSIGVGGTRTSRTSTTSVPSSKVSSLGARGNLHQGNVGSTSSRLLAPTASSLAKTAGVSKLKSGALNVPAEKPSDLPSPSNTTSPGAGKIFSKPLVVPMGSGLPSPVRGGSSQTVIQPGTGVARQRSVGGRKPRISRSKVIAKLASQRSASGPGSGPSTNPGPDNADPSAVGLAAKRSSLGVGVHKAPRKSAGGARRSHVGVSGTRSSEANVVLSAKKRARQSEYARRKSRAGAGNVGASSSMAMDVGS